MGHFLTHYFVMPRPTMGELQKLKGVLTTEPINWKDPRWAPTKEQKATTEAFRVFLSQQPPGEPVNLSKFFETPVQEVPANDEEELPRNSPDLNISRRSIHDSIQSGTLTLELVSTPSQSASSSLGKRRRRVAGEN